jgi:UDP-N-acetylmuramoyl-tripeptide--D-alanyl-D-alanine ligase
MKRCLILPKTNAVQIEQLYRIYREHPSVQTDTRKLKEGDVFFALSGPNFDGNSFAAEALAKGAVCAVVDDPEVATDGRYFLVPNVLECLQALARHHRRQLQIPVLAITGSNGKTTTKELIHAVLAMKYRVYATVGNLNNHIGVPLTLLKIGPDAEFAVVEMGANHQREIAGYCEVALPTHGLITNCGKAHLEGFGGVEGVRKGKGELYDYLAAHSGMIFRNADLDYLVPMSAAIQHQVTYGAANADYVGTAGVDGHLLNVGMTKPVQLPLETQLVGAYNFANVMAAATVGLHFGVEPEAIAAAVRHYAPDNSRSQWLPKGTNKVILDAYNANPTSMKEAILNFAGMDVPNKRLWIGGMKEMGDAEKAEHEALVALIDRYTWDEVVLVGMEFAPFKDKYSWFPTSAEAKAFLLEHKPENATILVKGSRGSRMELTLESL